MNFAITGVAGFVAPRHLQAIRDTGNQLLAALDPHDSVGILDRFFPEADYFSEFERFDRHLEKLRRRGDAYKTHFLSICSPNYLHDAHIRLALRLGATALCEKPLVINPWNLDALAELERESEGRIFAVQQLRLHPAVATLRERLASPAARRSEVLVTYVTPRGRWYRHSWKGSSDRSGGLVANIGVHLFDLVLWLFGAPQVSEVHVLEETRAAGFLALQRADVRWFLSTAREDLPPEGTGAGRGLWIDGENVNLSVGFEDLHTRVYAEALAGRGCGIEDARPAIELVYRIRTATAAKGAGPRHPNLEKRS